MVSFPFCKINLGLNIIGKRPDGYHDLVTCFYPVPWTDILEIIPSDKTTLTFSGNRIPGRDEDNLCLKAYQILKADHRIDPVKIHLHKIIPTGAGIGGGSSDAAFTLRLLNTIFDLNLSVSRLKEYASQVGSDCSFFLEDSPKLGTEKGDVLTDISVSLKGKFLVIVKPELHISTAEAYAGVKPKHPLIDLKEILKHRPITEWKTLLKNDFEETVFKKHEGIRQIKEKLYSHGAIYASMSGSGSSVFGIFDKEADPDFSAVMLWKGWL
jgi:4-diphosphocytidyl-2-C-methyl-D-erythritol kinase